MQETIGIDRQTIAMLKDGKEILEDYKEILQDLQKDTKALAGIKINIIDQSTSNTIKTAADYMNGLTTAVTTFNGVTKMATTGIEVLGKEMNKSTAGKVILAISTVISALSLLSSAFEDAGDKSETMEDRLAGIANAYTEAGEAAKRAFTEQNAEMSVAETQLGSIQSMMAMGFQGASLDLAIENFLELVPDAKDDIKKIGDEWVIQQGSLDKIIDKIKEMAMLEQASSEVKAATTNRYNTEEELSKALDKKARFERDNSEFITEKTLISEGWEQLKEDAKEANIDYDEYISKGEGLEDATDLRNRDIKLRRDHGELYEEYDAINADIAQAQTSLDEAVAAEEKATDDFEQLNMDIAEKHMFDTYLPQTSEALLNDIDNYSDPMNKLLMVEEELAKGTPNITKIGNQLGVEGLTDQESAQEAYEQQRKEDLQELASSQLSIISELLGPVLAADPDSEEWEKVPEEQRDVYQEYVRVLNGVLSGNVDDMNTLFNNIKTGKWDINFQVNGQGGVVKEGPWGKYVSYGGKAEGTNFWQGGYTVINERGDEMIELPTGSKIYPAHETDRKLQEIMEPSGEGVVIHVGSVAIREDADIDRIATELVERLERASLAMA